MTVASKLSTTGMDVVVLVGVDGRSVGVNVSVGGASVAVDVSVGITIASVAVEVAGAGISTGAAEGSVQAVSRKIKPRKTVK